jgi:hypothetical protein
VHDDYSNTDGVFLVKADWTGIGPISTVKDKTTGITTLSRSIVATGTIRGAEYYDFSATMIGELTEYK